MSFLSTSLMFYTISAWGIIFSQYDSMIFDFLLVLVSIDFISIMDRHSCTGSTASVLKPQNPHLSTGHNSSNHNLAWVRTATPYRPAAQQNLTRKGAGLHRTLFTYSMTSRHIMFLGGRLQVWASAFWSLSSKVSRAARCNREEEYDIPGAEFWKIETIRGSPEMGRCRVPDPKIYIPA